MTELTQSEMVLIPIEPKTTANCIFLKKEHSHRNIFNVTIRNICTLKFSATKQQVFEKLEYTEDVS